MTILYITQNGITDHIGRSQVAPYVLGLARLGFPIHVLSAEKSGREALVARYEADFREAGVAWTWVAYRPSPPVLGQVWTQLDMERAARRIVKTGEIRLVHCRSFPPALIGYRLNRSFGVPYIFDFRDFYAENGLAKARGPSRLFYRYFKHMERPMIRGAVKIVCLTERAVEILTDWYLTDEREPSRRFMVVPCCADFDHYDPAKVTSAARQAALAKAGLEGQEFVLLYLGSLGAEYLLDEMISLFRQVQIVRPRAIFLFVCNNGRELVDEACRRHEVDTNAIRFATADRDDVPAFISLANLSVIFIRSDISKAGCSPTKLAELLAMNVPVIANSGVGDLDRLLDIRTNGSTTVSGYDEATLRAAVEDVVRAAGTKGTNIRGASEAFGLDEGIRRYATVYNELLRR